VEVVEVGEVFDYYCQAFFFLAVASADFEAFELELGQIESLDF